MTRDYWDNSEELKLSSPIETNFCTIYQLGNLLGKILYITHPSTTKLKD